MKQMCASFCYNATFGRRGYGVGVGGVTPLCYITEMHIRILITTMMIARQLEENDEYKINKCTKLIK